MQKGSVSGPCLVSVVACTISFCWVCLLLCIGLSPLIFIIIPLVTLGYAVEKSCNDPVWYPSVLKYLQCTQLVTHQGIWLAMPVLLLPCCLIKLTATQAGCGRALSSWYSKVSTNVLGKGNNYRALWMLNLINAMLAGQEIIAQWNFCSYGK